MESPKVRWLVVATLVLGIMLMFVALGISVFVKMSAYYEGMAYGFLESGAVVAFWGIAMMCFLCKTKSPEQKEELSKPSSPSSYSPGSEG